MEELGEDFRTSNLTALPPGHFQPMRSRILALGFGSFLVAGALYVPLVLQFWSYPKAWLVLLLMVAGGVGWLVSGLGAWSLMDSDVRTVVSIFRSATVVAVASWIYLVLTATEIDYIKMVDGEAFSTMARTLLDNGAFLRGTGQPSEHYGPLYALYLVPFYAVSRDILATKVAILTMGALSLAVVHWTTRRLYGPWQATVTVGLVAAIPTLMLMTSRNLAEYLLVLLYTMVVYCLMRSLEPGRERYVIAAGLFAGMAYLTKSSTGLLFLVAGVAGFLWRFRQVRWAVLRDRHYRSAILVFLAMVGAWVARNLYVFWRPYMGRQAFINSWNGDFYFNGAMDYVFPSLGPQFIFQAFIFLAFMAPFYLAYFWPFLPDLRRGLARRREPRVGLLVTSVVVPIGLGAAVSAIYFMWERYREQGVRAGLPEMQAGYFALNTIRYIVVTLVPLLWLAFEARRPAPGGTSLELP